LLHKTAALLFGLENKERIARSLRVNNDRS
jgi:hypothetical protein